MTKRQQRFAEEYLIDLDIKRAYKSAGYKGNVKSAYRLLKNTDVKRAIEQGIKERSERTGISQDKVLFEIANIAFANGADFIKLKTEGDRTNVMPVDTDEIAAEKLAAINYIKKTSNGVEIKMYDKLKALELLGKHLGIFDHKNDEVYEDLSEIRGEIFGDSDEDA